MIEPINKNGAYASCAPFNQSGFKNWFGSSQVVDSQGKPLVVYHGTNQDIERFDDVRLGENTGSITSGMAFFFTESHEEAAEYANMSARRQVSNAVEREAKAEYFLKALEDAQRRRDFDEEIRLIEAFEASEHEAMTGEVCGANILPVYLCVQNPLVVDLSNATDLQPMADAIELAKANGHDGVKLLNVYDPVGNREGLFTTTQWAVFDARQIKSAIGNSGLFDKNSPSLCDRFKREPNAHERVATYSPFRPRG